MTRFWKWGCAAGAVLGIAAVITYRTCYAGTEAAKDAPVEKQAESLYSAFARGRIDVEGGLVNIAAQKDGIISEVRVEEGDRVKKGQILCTQVDTAERLALELEKAQLFEIEKKIARLEIALAAAQREDKRHQELASKSIISNKEFDERRDTLRLCQSDLHIVNAALETARRKLAVAGYDVEQRIVRAPADGTILRCDVRPGYGTTSSSNVTRLFVFVPDLPYIVRAELEEKFVRLVKAGMEAEVIPDADESKSYKAKVLRVSNYLGPKRMSFDDPMEKSDVKTSECILSIDAKDLILQQRVLVKFKK